MANAPDAGQNGPFEVSVSYTPPKTNNGIVEVFDYSAKDGSVIDLVNIPVAFQKVETMKVNVYFGNSKTDPNAANCDKAYAAEREIPKTEAPARAALEALLAGPNAAEKEAGFFSSINPGVIIQKLAIENGAAKVDFSKELEQAVGGSCRVAAIRAQITETLKQFATVKSVVISIDGRTEDVLQP
jgi:spore germination protein GerM